MMKLVYVNETKAKLFFFNSITHSERMLKNAQYDTTHGPKAKRPINELHMNHKEHKTPKNENEEKKLYVYYVITALELFYCVIQCDRYS